MEVVHLKRVFSEKDANKKFLGKSPSEKDADKIYRKEATRFLGPDGEEVATVLRGAVPVSLERKYQGVVKKSFRTTNNRGTASGQKLKLKVKENGTISKVRVSAKKVESSILGYFERTARLNFCRKAGESAYYSGASFNVLREYAEHLSDLFKKVLPEEYEKNKLFSDKISPDFRLGSSLYTTITLNRNFRTFYHRDKGNSKEVMSTMTVASSGSWYGGDLIFPEYGFGVELRGGDAIIMKNTSIHGNTRIKGFGDFKRVTSVFYARARMIYCGLLDEELERVSSKDKGDGLVGSISEDLNKGRWH